MSEARARPASAISVLDEYGLSGSSGSWMSSSGRSPACTADAVMSVSSAFRAAPAQDAGAVIPDPPPEVVPFSEGVQVPREVAHRREEHQTPGLCTARRSQRSRLRTQRMTDDGMRRTVLSDDGLHRLRALDDPRGPAPALPARSRDGWAGRRR